MKRIFYGWIVCAVCTLLIFISMGTASNGLSVFLPHIIRVCGLTGTQASSLVTLRCGFAFLAMLLISHYYEWLGYRTGTCISALCCCAAYFIYSFAGSYPLFCVGAAMAGISYGLGSMIPVSILMNRWFVRHRALAIGICASGSGLAVIILPPILTRIILRFSLRAAFLITASYCLAAAILIFLLIREKPGDKGLEPLGRAEMYATHRSGNNAGSEQNGEAAGPAGQTHAKSGWVLMGLMCVIMGALSNPGFVHLSVLYTSENYTPMTVAYLISVCGVVLTLGKVLCGEAADRMGGFRSSLLFLGLLFAGNAMCCLAFTGSVPLAVIAVFLFGVGSPVCTVGIPVWAGDLSSPDRYPETVRNLQLIYAAGAMIFASAPGVIADHLGSYIPVYALFAVSVAAAGACLCMAYRRR